MRTFNILCYVFFAIIIFKIIDSVLLWTLVCLLISFVICCLVFIRLIENCTYSFLQKFCIGFLTVIFCLGLIVTPALINEWYFSYECKKSKRELAVSISRWDEGCLIDCCSPFRLCNADTLRSFGISVPDKSRKKLFWKFEKGLSYEDAEEYIVEFKKLYNKDSVGDFRLYDIAPLLDMKEKLYGLKFTYDYGKQTIPLPQDISPSMYECIASQYGTAYLRSCDKFHNCAFWNKNGIGVAMVCRIPEMDGDRISSYSRQCEVYIYHTKALWERVVFNKYNLKCWSLREDSGIIYW